MIISELLMYTVAALFFLPLFLLFLVSLAEKDYRAARRSLRFSLISPLPFIVIAIVNFPGSAIVSYALAALTLFFLVLLLFPYKTNPIRPEEKLKEKYDERDVIFVRNRLVEGSEQFSDYYERKPELLERDNRFREAPGLLSPESIQANPFMYSSAAASFQVCENLIPLCDGPVAEMKIESDPVKITRYIKEWAGLLGVVSIGITELKDDHRYSIGGRREKYGKPVINNHKYAIAFTVEMDRDSLRRGPKAPTVMESARQYLNAGTIAVQIAAFIRGLGHSAKAHIDASYEVVCPLVARDAGLGELGRTGLLITPELGSRVRINVVTTDLPLITDTRGFEGSVADFCEHCMKCADVCPSRSIPKGERQIDNGVLRWKIDHEKCFTFWSKSGTDCGRCVAVCPYSHPDNAIHKAIRFFIRKSPLFRRFGATLDDLIYGRKPKPLGLADWQKI
ncbi:4Fe-4S dicluster domain-containing protein [Spirochaeta isovalerica]|uniref:Reductive dehalogenase n=1 Tax=Spirochaeta isovalerica TaxID=150 RepID=A0A841RFZ1_9SPIO|nr:reductive dehalogenase domain-containing protein [Spirochaeta isovalerica]MBB6482506.1 reductive dehalogenase [Spirochaeta isovalerica]